MNRLDIKYDVGLDLTSDNSLKLIDDRVRDNALVLEFGPANGRYTRHLHENRQCTVDIVEYNAASGSEAARYARTAILGTEEGDIEKYIWAGKLAGQKYDFIIFADVLEHLYNPEKVLERCRDFLKEDGAILVSVPNIANNNIIINLLSDEFNYTPTGLLDDTHIRFFTYKTMFEMAARLRYGVSNLDCVIGRVGETEVDVKLPPEMDFSLAYEHQLGNVFQWIFELRLDAGATAWLKELPLKYIPRCYFMSEGGYSEETRLDCEDITCEGGIYEAVFDLPEGKLEDKIRFDPLEGIFCRVKLIEARTELGACEAIFSNATLANNGEFYFLTTDPMLELACEDSSAKKLSIRYQVQPFSVRQMTDDLLAAREAHQKTMEEHQKTQEELTACYHKIGALDKELAQSRALCREREEELQMIKSTRGWRWLVKFRETRDKLKQLLSRS